MIDNNGRDEQELNYEPIKDKSIEEPFTAYFRKKDGVSSVKWHSLLDINNIFIKYFSCINGKLSTKIL